MESGLNILYPVEPPVDWNAEPFELRLPSGTKLQPFRIPFLDQNVWSTICCFSIMEMLD